MENTIDFQFKARYYTEGSKESAEKVLFVLHGYGQLAKYFIRKFSELTDRSVYIIAPEALSLFYMENVSTRSTSGDNRVGASWMTRENRSVDITNYLNFLNAIYHHELDGKKIPVTVLGFSQGAATASRWIMDGKIDFEKLILWAGILPPDIDFDNKEILKNKETILVYGNRDPFINDSRFTEMNLLTEKLSITPRVIQFDGAHDIDTQTLLNVV